MLRLLIVGVSLLLGVASTSIRADDVPNTAASTAEDILRRLLDEREKLLSGVCRVRGRKFAHGGANPDVDAEVRSLIAFDFAKGLFRYDDDDPSYRGLIKSADFKMAGGDKAKFDELLKSARPKLVNTKLRYIQNTEYVALWYSNSDETRNDIHLYKPEKIGLGGDLSEIHHLHDVRACGLLDFVQFSSGAFQSGVRVAEYCNQLLKTPVIKVEKSGLGTQIAFQDERWSRDLTIDTSNGFCAVDYIVASRETPPLVSNAQTKWTRMGDVWVPKAMFIQLVEPDGNQVKYTLEYEWESVNSPVDPGYFDYKSFKDIPTDYVCLVDARGEQPMLIGNWRGDGKIEGLDRPSAGLNAPMTWNAWVVVIGSLALVALLGWLYALKKRIVRH